MWVYLRHRKIDFAVKNEFICPFPVTSPWLCYQVCVGKCLRVNVCVWRWIMAAIIEAVKLVRAYGSAEMIESPSHNLSAIRVTQTHTQMYVQSYDMCTHTDSHSVCEGQTGAADSLPEGVTGWSTQDGWTEEKDNEHVGWRMTKVSYLTLRSCVYTVAFIVLYGLPLPL